MGTDPAPRGGGEPAARSSPNLRAGSSGHRPRGKTQGKNKKESKAENTSSERLSRHTGKTSSASKRRHFLSSPLSTLSGSPALKRGEIRASAGSLSPPDRGAIQYRGRLASPDLIFSFFFVFKPPEQRTGRAEGGNTLRDASYRVGDATKSSPSCGLDSTQSAPVHPERLTGIRTQPPPPSETPTLAKPPLPPG